MSPIFCAEPNIAHVAKRMESNVLFISNMKTIYTYRRANNIIREIAACETVYIIL